MNSWIDLHALWKILVVGLLAGAGLPAIFAIGLRALSLGPKNTPAPLRAQGGGGVTARSRTTPGGQNMVGGSPVGLVAAVVCFALVLAGIGWGIYFVVAGS